MLEALHQWLSTSSWTVRGRVNALHAKVDRLADAVERLQAAQARDDTRNLAGKIDRLAEAVAEIQGAQKQDEKWKSLFRRQMNSVIRYFYLADGDVAAPHALAGRRFRLRSQNEEDGIVLALLKAGALKTRRFVEIGSGGTGGNSGVLAAEFGWSGLMVDASARAVEQARFAFGPNPGVKVVQAFVTPDSVNQFVAEHGFGWEIDVLSIDIDSIDYWILDALEACRPRVIVMEYNALFGPSRAVTLPNTPVPDAAPKGYAGASLAALEKVASRKGFRLVVCEDMGVNAFFLRNDIAPGIPALTPQQAWRPMRRRYDSVSDSRVDLPIDDLIRKFGLPLVEV